jgi:hypothetical protein
MEEDNTNARKRKIEVGALPSLSLLPSRNNKEEEEGGNNVRGGNSDKT